MDKVNISKEQSVLLKCKLKGITPLPVVAGLIEKDGKYLIAQRLTGNPSVVGRWEFPGGKINDGESEKNAIEREIKEEFDLNIQGDKFICNVVHEYPGRIIDLRLWHALVLDDHIDMDEKDHEAYKWVSLEEIGQFELCPADQELYNIIVDKN